MPCHDCGLVTGQVHEEYIVAGCTVITANNFPCTPWGLSRIDRGEDFIRLTKVRASYDAPTCPDRAGIGAAMRGLNYGLSTSYILYFTLSIAGAPITVLRSETRCSVR